MTEGKAILPEARTRSVLADMGTCQLAEWTVGATGVGCPPNRRQPRRRICWRMTSQFSHSGCFRPGRAWQTYRAVTAKPAVRSAWILCIALTAGCAGVSGRPPIVLAQSSPLIVDSSLIEPGRRPPAATDSPVPAAKMEVIAVPVKPVVRQNAPSAALPAAKPPAKAPSAAAPLERTTATAVPGPAARVQEPALDVAALKARLRDTSAIGVFTKLALKNQVDDLLQQFRSHYQGGQKISVATLRPSYELLVLKVLALVQDADPPLARTISGSREAIWGILADPEKFKMVS